MKYIIYKITDGNIEFGNGDIKIVLTNKFNCVELGEEDYFDVIEGHESLIRNGFILVKQIPEVKEVEKTKSVKKEMSKDRKK